MKKLVSYVTGSFVIGVVGLILTTLCLTSCGDNTSSAQYGGTQTVNLKPGEKLENVTWKSMDGHTPSLWILTRQRHAGEQPEVHEFQEKSNFGVVQGRVVIVER